jgi:energy-coupling factor transporter ATP-binding protein EcfA2
MNAFCTQSSVVVVAGKGGVGKSTLSATVARLAARHGVSVLLVELEEKSGASGLFGHHDLTSDEVELSVVTVDQGAGDRGPRSAPIRARTITPDDALVDYLVDHGFGRLARRLARSGMLDVAATAIPGLRDILVLSKIVQLERAHAADLIVVDGPAAGHATTFLTSAHGLLDSSRAGPIHAQAADAVELLSDPVFERKRRLHRLVDWGLLRQGHEDDLAPSRVGQQLDHVSGLSVDGSRSARVQ